jgi:indolepyruvate ferredoxin oxidoreductase beta subunit
MKTDLILAGVGGQGILTIAATLGMAALNNDFYLKQSEVHGMSQRGGEVQAHLRISDKEIASDLIADKTADLIIAVEPMEGLRYLNYLHDEGWLITNSRPYKNIPNYPDVDALLAEIEKVKNHIVLDADAMAKEIKATRSSNIIMLGAASPFINMDYQLLEEGIRTIFSRKGEDVVNINIKALKIGREFTEEKLNR